MSWSDGLIKPVYEGHCRGCEEPLLGLSGTRPEAVIEIKKHGWQCVGGRWFCKECAESRSRSQLMTIARWTP